MAYDKRKIANSFYLPKHPFLRGIASLMDFTGSLNHDTFIPRNCWPFRCRAD